MRMNILWRSKINQKMIHVIEDILNLPIVKNIDAVKFNKTIILHIKENIQEINSLYICQKKGNLNEDA